MASSPSSQALTSSPEDNVYQDKALAELSTPTPKKRRGKKAHQENVIDVVPKQDAVACRHPASHLTTQGSNDYGGRIVCTRCNQILMKASSEGPIFPLAHSQPDAAAKKKK